MTQRDAVLVLVAVVLAVGIAAILLVGSMSAATAGDRRPPQLVFQGRPQPGRVVDLDRQLPGPIRPIAPIERGVADASRDAAGYLLVLLAVSATIVLAREQVLSAYRASLGGWRAVARTFATGIAVLLLIGSALFLSSVVFLGAVAGGNPFTPRGPFGPPTPPGPGPAFGVQLGIQAGFVVFSVMLVLVALPALVGFAAAAWRLGDGILGLRVIARWGSLVPPPLVALLGATVIYLLAQVPVVGIVVGVAAVAYALGSFVAARLEPRAAGT